VRLKAQTLILTKHISLKLRSAIGVGRIEQRELQVFCFRQTLIMLSRS